MPALLKKSDSHDGLQAKLQAALSAKHGSGSKYEYDGGVSVHDVWPGKVVHTIASKGYGKKFASKYTVKPDGSVELGEPEAVEPAYTPLKEAFQGDVMPEIMHVKESAYDVSTGKIKLTVIKPGFNKSKSRYYPASTLRRDYHVFKGAKMFMNHQTEAEQRSRPEGNVQDWVADLDNVFVESDGTIKGEGVVHDPTFKAKLEGLKQAGKLANMGVSIRAFGLQQEAEIEGTKTMFVENFKGAKSVDFVTFPGAGGSVDMFEANNAADIDFITPEQLAERRPDLVKHFTESAAEEAAQAMTTEQELQESQRLLKEANAKIAEMQESGARATAAATLKTKLDAAALPESAKTRIAKQFAEAKDDKGMQEAIDEQVAYIKELGVDFKAGDNKSGKGKIATMGESATAQTGTKDEAAERAALIKSWKSTGMSEAEATAAAESYFCS